MSEKSETCVTQILETEISLKFYNFIINVIRLRQEQVDFKKDETDL